MKYSKIAWLMLQSVYAKHMLVDVTPLKCKHKIDNLGQNSFRYIDGRWIQAKSSG